MPQAISLSLHFSVFELAGEGTTASFVKVTSLRDGDSALLFESSSWIETLSGTPHFNGESVLFELIAFPGTGTNRVVGDQAWAGIPISGDPDWLCFERNRFVRGDANFDGALNWATP